jgi:hypothetical protein
MEVSRRWFVSALAAASASGASGLAQACGFEGVFDGGFGTIHPRAIEIALAVRSAVADGLLPQTALDPVRSGEAGLWQATEKLKGLGRHLSDARATGLQSSGISLLCSEASLWTRYIANGRSFDTVVHVGKPAPADAIVITDLAVIAALGEARLTAQRAIARNLLLIEASRESVGAVTSLLAAACDKAQTAAVDFTSRTPWGPPGLR